MFGDEDIGAGSWVRFRKAIPEDWRETYISRGLDMGKPYQVEVAGLTKDGKFEPNCMRLVNTGPFTVARSALEITTDYVDRPMLADEQDLSEIHTAQAVFEELNQKRG